MSEPSAKIPNRLPGAYAAELIEHVRKVRASHGSDSESGGFQGLGPKQLADLLNVAFFASLREEEGRRCVFSLALERAEALERAAGGPQDVRMPLSRPLLLSVEAVAKLAAATDPERTHIVVSLRDETLWVTGLLHSLNPHPYLRVRGHRPGVVAVDRWGDTWMLYATGQIHLFDPAGYFDRMPQGAIHQWMPEWHPPATLGIRRASIVRLIAAGMVRQGHGGMLLVVPSTTEAVSCLDDGYAFPADAAPAFASSLDLTEAQPMIECLGRLTAVDGALVIDAKSASAGVRGPRKRQGRGGR